MTLQGGSATAEGLSPYSTFGWGLLNQGQLTLEQVFVSFNEADDGGGVANLDFLEILTSTVYGNNAARGGDLLNVSPGEAMVTHSTISGNTADQRGGLPDPLTVTMMGRLCVTLAPTSFSYKRGGISPSALRVGLGQCYDHCTARHVTVCP
jgi:hypothetical protein